MTPEETEDFRRNGFFSSYTETARANLRKSLSEWIDFISELNAFAHSTLARCEVRDGDLIHLFSLSTFSRALVTFQASFFLAERGMDCDSKSLQRKLLEETLVMRTCQKDRQLAEKFIAADQEHRRKLLKGLLSSPSKETDLSRDQLSKLEAEHRMLEAKKQQNPPPRVGYDELAADTPGLYNIQYRFLSMFSHPVPSGMATELVQKEGKIVGVRTGPDFGDAYDNLARLTLFLLFIINCAADIFHLQLADQLLELHDKREALLHARPA